MYNDFPKLTGLRVPKVTILTHSQRSIGQYMCRFLYNDFYFNDRFLLVNSLELALRYIYIIYSICGQHAISFFLNSSAQHRGNEAEPDSNGNKNAKGMSAQPSIAITGSESESLGRDFKVTVLVINRQKGEVAVSVECVGVEGMCVCEY